MAMRNTKQSIILAVLLAAACSVSANSDLELQSVDQSNIETKTPGTNWSNKKKVIAAISAASLIYTGYKYSNYLIGKNNSSVISDMVTIGCASKVMLVYTWKTMNQLLSFVNTCTMIANTFVMAKKIYTYSLDQWNDADNEQNNKHQQPTSPSLKSVNT